MGFSFGKSLQKLGEYLIIAFLGALVTLGVGILTYLQTFKPEAGLQEALFAILSMVIITPLIAWLNNIRKNIGK